MIEQARTAPVGVVPSSSVSTAMKPAQGMNSYRGGGVDASPMEQRVDDSIISRTVNHNGDIANGNSSSNNNNNKSIGTPDRDGEEGSVAQQSSAGLSSMKDGPEVNGNNNTQQTTTSTNLQKSHRQRSTLLASLTNTGEPMDHSRPAQAVRCTRILVVLVLFLSTSGLAVLTFISIRDQQETDFKQQFQEVSGTLLSISGQKIQDSVLAVNGLGQIYSSFASATHQRLPFMTLVDTMESYGFDIRIQTGALSILYIPFLYTTNAREAWDNYTTSTLSTSSISSAKNHTSILTPYWIERSQQIVRTVVPNFTYYNPSLFPIRNYTWINDPMIQQQPIPDRTIPPYAPIWQMSPPPFTKEATNMINQNAYHVLDTFNNINNPSPTTTKSNNNNSMGSTLFTKYLNMVSLNSVPILTAPIDPNYFLSNELFFKPWLQSGTFVMEKASIMMHSLLHSPFNMTTSTTGSSSSSSSSNLTGIIGPMSMLFVPVLAEGMERAAAAATLLALLPWRLYFDQILSDDSFGIYMVAESCQSDNHTYMIRGPYVEYLGPGDLHDPKYNYLGQKGIFLPSLSGFGPNNTYLVLNQLCSHTIHVFPTESMEGQFVNKDPWVYMMLVVAMFIFSMFVFVMYDVFVTRKQARAHKKVLRTDAIVDELFPGAVRDQLFTEENTNNPKNKNKVDDSSKAHDDHHTPEKQGSIMFAKGDDTIPEEDTNAFISFVAEGENRSMASKPIAELFPEATVMFADIAGFTAWSSIREPTHVFTLLESIFQAFDEVAKKRGVFKVETVGDCYVAVVGIPQYRKDHAIVMSKFARDALDKFLEVVHGLELTLGPDTGDLAMRFGLHSGPVTAGVLRGDRARFQLFGETVITAEKIQHTGNRNFIHLSEQTAALIIAAGRGNWVQMRQDMVDVKGDNDPQQTYWLTTRKAKSNPSQTNSSQIGVEEDAAAKLKALEASNSNLDGVRGSNDTEGGKEKSTKKSSGRERRIQRLVDWNCELLAQLLRQVVAYRRASGQRQLALQQDALVEAAQNIGGDATMVVEEVANVIALPDFDDKAYDQDVSNVELSAEVFAQLHSYVAVVASMYRDNPFHNFEHASHVTMSVSKLLARIVAPKLDHTGRDERKHHELMHDHTYGITSDPLTQFAVVLSALVHDVDHRGVPNFLLAKEDVVLAAAYQNRSIAEQNSVDLAWNALMSPGFEALRDSIFTNMSELRRFRQLLVNSVIATDIFDKELASARKARWEKAFSLSEHGGPTNEYVHRKATIVIEHLIQASDVAHTMQHWHIYVKWNERLFQEMYQSYLSGRSDKDPSLNWYQGEIGFYDNYIIPLAKKLKDCGVFGVSSDEYLNYAEQNRSEWEQKGEEIVKGFVAKMEKSAKIHHDDTANGVADKGS